MTINSKVEVRNEALRIAVMLKDVDSANIIEVSEQIEKYMLGGADMQEVYDPNAYFKELTNMLKEQTGSSFKELEAHYAALKERADIGLGIALDTTKTK